MVTRRNDPAAITGVLPDRALNRTEILSCVEREDPVQKEAWLHSDP